MSLVADHRLWQDFLTFSRAHLETWDIDPMYPLLRDVTEHLDEETRVWRVFLYVVYYHVGAAERTWLQLPRPAPLPDGWVQPTGTERRGFRGSFSKPALHIARALDKGITDLVPKQTGRDGWDEARAKMQALPHGGPWSGYKWADLCKHVLGCDIEATDLGVGGGSPTAGPIPGMVLLTGRDWRECARNVSLQRDLLGEAKWAGVPFAGLDQIETALCDFCSLVKGRYYVGHDIDDQMSKLKGCSASLWEARQRVFHRRLLGEVWGWSGVRKELKTLYKRTGKVWLP